MTQIPNANLVSWCRHDGPNGLIVYRNSSVKIMVGNVPIFQLEVGDVPVWTVFVTTVPNEMLIFLSNRERDNLLHVASGTQFSKCGAMGGDGTP